jgi:hypothetical protein
MPSPAELEARFCRDVAALAQRRGLLVHWCIDSRKCVGDRGFPDLTIAGPHGVIFAECKMPDSETSANQDLWGHTIYRASSGMRRRLAYRIWFPQDLGNGTIDQELKELCSSAMP